MSFSTAGSSVMLRPCLPADLPFVMAAERHANNLAYVGQWSYEQHQSALESSDKAHFILEGSEPPRRVGYAILEELNNPNGSILLRRIVVTEKGQGFGRAALKQLKQLVFDIYKAHRFWLDVKAFNPRARHLYASEGFVLEGCLREALKTEDGYHSMYIMSLLRSEYDVHQQT
jgi:RimJ/RimL family protein N-acetyltransferase